MARTPPPTHPKPSVNADDNDGEGTTAARDEPSGSVSSNLPQPGAFPIPGPDGRRNSSSRRGSDSSLETGDAPRNDDASIALVLVQEANLVTDSDGQDDVPLVEGQAIVELSAAERERKQKQRRRFRILGFGLVVAVIAAGIAVGVTLGINYNRNLASTPSLSLSPSMSLLPSLSPSLPPSVSLSESPSLKPTLSPAPSTAPTMRPLFRQFQESLPNYTKILLQDTSSPKYLAWGWLTSISDNLNVDLWKLRQRFALACFCFATTAFESYIVVPSDPVSPLEVDECNWTGIVCNASGSVIQIALQNSDIVGSLPQELYLSDLSIVDLAFNYDFEGILSSDLQLLLNLHLFPPFYSN